MSFADLESLYVAAVAALEAGDYATAIRKALACKMRLATLPDAERSLAGGGRQQLTLANAAALDGFIAQCKQLQSSTVAASRGVQRTKIEYGRARTDGDYC